MIMSSILNILIVEDNQFDADLICRELNKSDINFTCEIVKTSEAFEDALNTFKPEIILSDYSLPSFDGLTAFKIKQRVAPLIPFIIISGVIGEENAVALIKSGVTDFVSKDKLFSLSQRITRALKETKETEERKRISDKLRIQTEELIIANQELVFQNHENEKRAEHLSGIYSDLKAQKDKLRRANDLLIKQEELVKIINHELLVLNMELEERVAVRTKALSESEALFRNMMETISQMAWTVTAEAQANFFNKQWYKYTGMDYRQAKAQGWDAVTHPDDLIKSSQPFLLINDGSKSEWTGEIRYKRADGVYRWHLVSILPIMNENLEVQLWIGTATDIHDLKILQQQKDDFISIASHELKTPITSLTASLQLLNKIKDSPSVKTMPLLIEMANKSLNKVNVLIKNLLNVTQFNNGHLHLTKSWITLSQLVEDCCPEIRAEGIYTFKTEGNLDLKVYADAPRIDQVLVNFVNNALKYAPNSKDILITIAKVKNTAKVSITDRGQGIAADKIPHLFDRYFRVDSTGTQYSGLGLGLYISGEIIQKHNGEIGADSVVGKGSTFWFTLPIDQTEIQLN
jgi:PAS domain S-box-containing protein